jgi:hypothetical protein
MNRSSAFAFSLITLFPLAAPAMAQDRVTYRDRAAKDKGAQTATGHVDAESLAGLKIGGKTIPATDVIDVTYEIPGAVRIQYNRAVAAESRKLDDAVKEYDDLVKTPGLAAARFAKRYAEFKLATLKAAKADEAGTPAAAVEALTRFRKDHPDSWEAIPATRLLARTLLEKEPPDADGARRLYEELGQSPGAPPELRLDCAFQVIDLLIQANKPDEAKRKLAELPATDPRVKVYQIGCDATPTTLDAALGRLQAVIDETTDPALKAAAYVMKGDSLRRDPRRKKDALFEYLWVDVVYNQDPQESAKAVDRLADLFKELKDDARAEQYRRKARGR